MIVLLSSLTWAQEAVEPVPTVQPETTPGAPLVDPPSIEPQPVAVDIPTAPEPAVAPSPPVEPEPHPEPATYTEPAPHPEPPSHAEPDAHAESEPAPHAEPAAHTEPQHHPESATAEPAHVEGHSEPEPHPAHGLEPEPAPPTERHPTPVPQAAPAGSPSQPNDWTFFDFLDPEPERPEVIVIQGDQSVRPSVWERILPNISARGLRGFLPLALLAMLAGALATVFRRVGADLRASGLFPMVLRNGEVVLRMLVAFFGVGALGALVPASIAPALPVVVLAAAVAVGWSARDVLQDLVAGVFLGVEGQLRSGNWVRGNQYAGTVEAIGLRVTWLRDVYGRRIVVPNRILLTQPLVADDNPWPRIQFTVSMPTGASVQRTRAALEEAILLSPWVAPIADRQVHPDALTAGHWHVAVRLLDSRYADRFQGLLRERVEEILAT